VKRKTPGALGDKPYKVLIGDSRLEYKALKKLSLVVFVYWAGLQFIGFLFFVIYFSANTGTRPIFEKRNMSHVWFSMFYTAQAFQNCGFGSLEDFNLDAYVLITFSVLIMAGNVAYPIFLRLIVTVIHKCAKKKTVWRFILDHPRRCFTHLFSNGQTKWLATTIIGLILVEVVAFLALDWNLSVFTPLPIPARFLNAYFHAVSTRAVGWNSVDINQANPAMLIIWAVMMYISSYPVSLSVRSVVNFFSFSEPFSQFVNRMFRASTIGKGKQEFDEEGMVYKTEDTKFRSMWGNQAKSLLARDATLVFLAIFVIAAAESSKLRSDKENFTIFHIIFEVFSAYGTVGMSMGYNGNPASFSAVLTPFSKIVICALMLAGRHRGLPDSIDRAVQWNRKEIQFERFKKSVTPSTSSSPLTNHRSTRQLLEIGSPLMDQPRRNRSRKFHSDKEASSDDSQNQPDCANTKFMRRGVSIDMGEFEFLRAPRDAT
jgi:Trk-type K+ transport system membrane component